MNTPILTIFSHKASVFSIPRRDRLAEARRARLGSRAAMFTWAAILAVGTGAMSDISAAREGAAGAPASPTIKAVVELFTSQGCSSCPPADKVLETYAEQPDIVALTFPVDYWDYLGWKDTFASAVHTKRQRAYALARRDGAVYTPQAVINGGPHLVGFDKSEIDKVIAKAASGQSGQLKIPVRISIRDEQHLIVEADAAPAGFDASEITVWVVAVQKRGTVKIKRGENHGKTLTYCNIVRGMTPVGMWDGKPAKIRLAIGTVEKPNADSYVVLLQQGMSGPIVGAATLGH